MNAGWKTRNRRRTGSPSRQEGLSVEEYLEQLVEKKRRSSWKMAHRFEAVKGRGKRAICLPYRQAAAIARG